VYPLIIKKVKKGRVSQVVHCIKGCITDLGMAFIPKAEENYWNSTGENIIEFIEYQQLYDTCKNEAVHSVLDQLMYSQHSLGCLLYKA